MDTEWNKTIARRWSEELWGNGDLAVADEIVVSRYTTSATDTVGFMGMAPTGRSIRVSAMQMCRFEKGKIVESWAVRDDLGVLRQLGHWPVQGGPQRAAPRPTN